MLIPSVLALSLEEALLKLKQADIQCEIKTLLPPRENEADYDVLKVRKYVVRQQQLSDDKIVLTVVYR